MSMHPIGSAQLRFDVDDAWRAAFPDASHALAVVMREPQVLLHYSERSRVALVEHEGALLVVKRCSREQASLARRLGTLVRPTEAQRAFRVLQCLRAAGARVPEPAFALERRVRGIVVDSWYAYRYADGRTATVGDAHLALDNLRALHALGWVHRDPHLGNFLLQSGGVLLLDCTRARRSQAAYARAFDLVLLDKCCRGLGHPGLPLADEGFPLRVARAHSRALVAWRTLKRRVRPRRRHSSPRLG